MAIKIGIISLFFIFSAKTGTKNVEGNCANWLIDNNNPASLGVKPLLIIISANQETLQ